MIKERPILFIDGFNLFIRYFSVSQAINATGDLVGGALGFLKSLRYLTQSLKPKQIYLVWEQGGASPRRKHIYPEYKANRARQKDFAKLYSDNGRINPMADQKNKAYQLQLLTKAISHLPICQLYLPEIECDDVIGWLCKGRFNNKDIQKIIISSDKDFYQLLEDPSVSIYDPGKKHIVDQKYVKEHFEISPRNITIARCLAGDDSDNITGVPGVGLKTASKRFKELLDDSVDLTIDWVIEESKRLQEGVQKPPKCYQDIVDNEEILRRNWRLMYLDIGCLMPSQISKLEYRIEEFVPKMNKIEYLKTFTAADIPITRDIDEVASELKYLIMK